MVISFDARLEATRTVALTEQKGARGAVRSVTRVKPARRPRRYVIYRI